METSPSRWFHGSKDGLVASKEPRMVVVMPQQVYTEEKSVKIKKRPSFTLKICRLANGLETIKLGLKNNYAKKKISLRISENIILKIECILS